MNIEVNYVALLAAGVAAMAVGFMWYSPSLFGKQWMKLMGHTKDSMEKAKKKMGQTYMLSFVVTLVSAYVLSHVMTMSESFLKSDSVTTGLTSAFWMWLGFVAPVQMTDVMFGGKSWNLFMINTGYQLASLLAMGLVLGLMR
jgi:hypothetical protein